MFFHSAAAETSAQGSKFRQARSVGSHGGEHKFSALRHGPSSRQRNGLKPSRWQGKNLPAARSTFRLWSRWCHPPGWTFTCCCFSLQSTPFGHVGLAPVQGVRQEEGERVQGGADKRAPSAGPFCFRQTGNKAASRSASLQEAREAFASY